MNDAPHPALLPAGFYDLLPPEHPSRQSIQRLIQACQRQIELDGKVPALLKGDAQSASRPSICG